MNITSWLAAHKAVLSGGLVAGALDMIYACAAYGARGVAPMQILQSVASGLLGREAYRGGLASAALGLALHFTITLAMAWAFARLAAAWPLLLERTLLAGLGYGLLLYLLMNHVVVPLSAAYPGQGPTGWMLVGALFAHGFLVGLPIAVMARVHGPGGAWRAATTSLT